MTPNRSQLANLTFDPFNVQISDEEILADLMYPSASSWEDNRRSADLVPGETRTAA